MREAHNQYKHSIKLLQKRFWTVCRISSAEKKQKGKQICLRGGKQTSANNTICHIFWMEEYSKASYKSLLFLLESQHTITLVTPRHFLFILSKKTLYSFPRCSKKYYTFSCVIVAQSPKYCSVLSPRQINHEETTSVCFLITSSCPHKHSVTLRTVSEKGQNLPSTSNWNVPTEILSGYQLGYMCQAWHTDQMLHQREIQWFYPWAGEAVKNLEMQWYRSVPHWPTAPSSSITVHLAQITVMYTPLFCWFWV